MGTMFLLANFCLPRVSMVWEKSNARIGAGLEAAAKGGEQPTLSDEAGKDGPPGVVATAGWGRCLSRARVRSPVPQQRSRTTASGRARMGRRMRAVRFHQERSRPMERM